VRHAGDTFEIEYRIEDAFTGAVRSGVETLALPPTELANVELKKGWIRAYLVLQTTSLKPVARMPGWKDGRIELPLAPRDLTVAAELVSAFREQAKSS
jgi:hypothetical protein